MKLLHRSFLRLAAGAVACSALMSVFFGLPARADSKAAAEFTLKTCSDAMEDFAKVEAAAREGGWAASAQPIPEAMRKHMRNRSMWTVSQSGETYLVSIWESLTGEEQKWPPRKVCSIFFRNKTVKRDEFFNLMSTGMELTFAAETRTPQRLTERYEINRYRPKQVHLTFISGLDGIVQSVLMSEMLTFVMPRAQPAAPPGVER